MRDLNTLTDLTGTDFVRLEVAYGISDTGYIVGEGLTSDGHRSAFLLAPSAVPEPATWGVIVGLTALASALGRRHPRRL